MPIRAAYEVLLFAAATWATISFGNSYPMDFGHPEYSIGPPLERWVLGALIALPGVVVLTVAYGLARRFSHWKGRPRLVRVGFAGAVCGVSFFAGGIIATSILGGLNIGGMIVYCAAIGAVAGMIISKWGVPANGAV